MRSRAAPLLDNREDRDIILTTPSDQPEVAEEAGPVRAARPESKLLYLDSMGMPRQAPGPYHDERCRGPKGCLQPGSSVPTHPSEHD